MKKLGVFKEKIREKGKERKEGCSNALNITIQLVSNTAHYYYSLS